MYITGSTGAKYFFLRVFGTAFRNLAALSNKTPIGIRAYNIKQGQTLIFNITFPEFLAQRLENSRLVRTNRPLVCKFSARARDRPRFIKQGLSLFFQGRTPIKSKQGLSLFYTFPINHLFCRLSQILQKVFLHCSDGF